MSMANFSWASNSANLITVAQQDSVADGQTVVNVLGLLWDTSKDTLTLNPKELTSASHSLIIKKLMRSTQRHVQNI